mmetsp:Transcript_4600/g.9413  ORF Transcript_4600/g.9413 Transcript_4600/m.9413 type:complete len:175 (+) Transcript_4600:36-560(+)|eukprot:CAMPEP_0185905484 /NCGR_PEP_ID=MMETSP0196C-20130402/4662_1 /TAXON_ID=2932 /ORGANISM="Alexandrium fundyense, Strain CCMP1719" /LENGTH=174 /DNA_ID=CAMNT_0028625025 /DNA_START=84 /DNA_END=608 /DNA_ORIENTATION=+
MADSAAHDAETHKEPAQLTQAECTAHALGEKECGNVAFKAQDWATAIGRYTEGVRYVLYANGHHGAPLGEDDVRMAVSLLSNCAAARLKQGNFELAVQDCTRALNIDKLNAKVYYRRAQAQLALGNHDAALEDTAQILDLEPENEEAKQLHSRIAMDAKRTKQKEKAFCSKMFG